MNQHPFSSLEARFGDLPDPRVQVHQGCIVMVDALNCQKDIAQTVIERQADDAFTLKANHHLSSLRPRC